MMTAEASKTWKASQLSTHEIGLSAPYDPLEGSCGADCLRFDWNLSAVIIFIARCCEALLTPLEVFRKLHFFCKGWCDISAYQPLFCPLPLCRMCQVTNCAAASKRSQPRLCKNRLCSSSLLKYGVMMHEKHMWWYLKCVRCLCMSRSRMGVGLEEPRGERSWLNKSWNSLQICLTRQKEGGREWGFTICLQHNCRNFVTSFSFFFSSSFFFLVPSSSFWINPHVKHVEGSRSRASSMSTQKGANHFPNVTPNIQRVKVGFQHWSVSLDFYQHWSHCCDDLAGRDW